MDNIALELLKAIQEEVDEMNSVLDEAFRLMEEELNGEFEIKDKEMLYN